MDATEKGSHKGARRWRTWDIGVCQRMQGEAGGREPSPADLQRIREVIAAIPREVRSILDAGCGNGWLSNRLNGGYEVVALDYLGEPLRYVKVVRLRGDLRGLPFADSTFDLVLCCEVLEHLEEDMCGQACRELARVAAKYILVTVPNDEDLDARAWKCPDCGVRFHPFGHLRSFGPAELRDLFADAGAEPLLCVEVRGIVAVRHRPEQPLLARLNPVQFGYWPEPARAQCPRCGSRGKRGTLLSNLWEGGLRLARFAFYPRCRQRSKWLLGVFRCR